ncbi:MAG: aryl-sulfate sulfotransferase [Alphaproteobacteria bacterium]|nr:aryl-sulfate sulfotransferase [Alphaproteobacteria bacterium]
MIKKSIAIAGHRTSIALEAEFWRAIEELAAREGLTLAAFVARLDEARVKDGPTSGLASYLRVAALKAAGAGALAAPRSSCDEPVADAAAGSA